MKHSNAELIVGVMSALLIFSALGLLLGPMVPWTDQLRGHWGAGDWAAWAQAVGSVAAIGVAIWLSRSQAIGEDRNHRGMATLFCILSLDAIRRAKTCANEGKSEDFRASVETLSEVIRQGQTVAVNRLPPRLAYEFTTVIASVVHVQALMRGMLMGDAEQRLPASARRLEDVLGELAALYGDLPDRLGDAAHGHAYRALLDQYKIVPRR